jgi:hypothetical protein
MLTVIYAAWSILGGTHDVWEENEEGSYSEVDSPALF